MKPAKLFYGAGLLFGLVYSHPVDASPLVVVELFTAQGCASCPAADQLMKKVATDASLLPLSYHVTYFDRQGWKDTFATKENTERHKWYVKSLKVDSLYTPHMIVNGDISVVGSDARSLASAIRTARSEPLQVPISILPDATGEKLTIMIGDEHTVLPSDTTLAEVHFNQSALTPVSTGENRGKTIESINNVVAFFPISLSSQYIVPLNSFTEDGIAYLLQSSQGRILGAGYYVKPKRAGSSVH